MTDEKFVFIQDVKEKKSIGRSSFNKRTHTGKGGRVRFPSDSLTKKELESMNGETKTYRINSPMKWQEFKSMPDDLESAYIKALRNKFDVPNIEIRKMFGVSEPTLYAEFKRLGGLGVGGAKKKWDKSNEWFAWLNGVKLDVKSEPEQEKEEKETEEHISEETNIEPVEIKNDVEPEKVHEAQVQAAPMSGNMVFQCKANQALAMISRVIGDANAKISIAWEILQDGDVANG